ncbi:hypothetical protein KI387_036486, partial [Taxus chinensis]
NKYPIRKDFPQKEESLVREESCKRKEKEKSHILDSPVRKKQRVTKRLELEETKKMEADKGDEYNDKCGEDENHPIYGVHELYEEVNEERDEYKE